MNRLSEQTAFLPLSLRGATMRLLRPASPRRAPSTGQHHIPPLHRSSAMARCLRRCAAQSC